MRVALAIGDAGGIGPELAARMLADRTHHADDTIVLGDRRLLERGAREAGVELDLPVVALDALGGEAPADTCLIDLGNCDPDTAPVGEATAHGGRAALQNFRSALLACRAGHADVTFFTPFNKHAMRLARARLRRRDRFRRPDHRGDALGGASSTSSTRSGMRASRRTCRSGRSSGLLSEERVFDSLVFTDEVMRAAGFRNVRASASRR